MEELEYKNKGIVHPTCDWDFCKALIEEAFDLCEGSFYDPYFLDIIWQVSTDYLTELEVSVIVDNDYNLFISKGSGVFVDYKNEKVSGMKIPIKCWIHTHPFGKAYFSGTDWRTINTQKPILNEAIVLGNKESMRWFKVDGEEYLSRTEEICLTSEEE
tara:strand:+ start:329 stop:802 length:474 start_codon:yes stop_codon:yes gene_type:complete